jgi:hypothetical protein
MDHPLAHAIWLVDYYFWSHDTENKRSNFFFPELVSPPPTRPMGAGIWSHHPLCQVLVWGLNDARREPVVRWFKVLWFKVSSVTWCFKETIIGQSRQMMRGSSMVQGFKGSMDSMDSVEPSTNTSKS